MSGDERCPLQEQHERNNLFASRSYAAYVPSLTAATFISLVVISQRIAAFEGHSLTVINGVEQYLAFPSVSASTRLPPERWVWTFGVICTWFCLLCPTMWLAWEVHRWAALPPRGCLLSAPIVAEALLLLASLGLLVLAIIPLQSDIYDSVDNLKLATKVHLICGAVFFVCSLAHGCLVVCWQAEWCRQRRRPPVKSSFIAKFVLTILSVATVLGPIPQLLLKLCSVETCGELGGQLRAENLIGIAQRLLILFIAGFLASYSLDVLDLQDQTQKDHKAGSQKFLFRPARV